MQESTIAAAIYENSWNQIPPATLGRCFARAFHLLDRYDAKRIWNSRMAVDLRLTKHGIRRLMVIGLIARTCVEATIRFAAELGEELTLVRGATADYPDVQMHAAIDVNIPNYACAIVTAAELIAALQTEPATVG